jgi:RHS repeat-associated protein
LTWKQQYLFGSSRLGEVVFDRPIESTTPNPFNYGERRYELTNHLGNVTTVFGENAVAYADTEDGTTYTAPALVSYRDYIAFGLGLDRGADVLGKGSYRYAFNSKELDDEGEWGSEINYDFGERIYSPSIGRYTSIDPFARSRTWTTPYNFVQNNPINRIDPTGGLDTIFYNKQGIETGRIRTTTGRHVYLLAHEEGTKEIHGQRYYQGNSYWSFFGDPARNSNELFEAVDTETFPSLSPDVVNGLVNIQYDGEGFVRTWYNSGPGGQFDFKNNKAIFGDNEKTAYLIDDVLYNRNEMGMFLWGGAMGKTDVKYSRLVQWNDYFHSKIEGNPDEWNEVFTWTTGFYITKYGSRNTSSIEKLLFYERWSSAPGYNLPNLGNPMLRGGDPTSGLPSFETETRRPNVKSTGLTTVFDNVLQVTTGFGTGPTDEAILNQKE